MTVGTDVFLFSFIMSRDEKNCALLHVSESTYVETSDPTVILTEVTGGHVSKIVEFT